MAASSGWSSWGGLGDVLKQANALKENLERQMDQAVGLAEEGEQAEGDIVGSDGDANPSGEESDPLERSEAPSSEWGGARGVHGDGSPSRPGVDAVERVEGALVAPEGMNREPAQSTSGTLEDAPSTRLDTSTDVTAGELEASNRARGGSAAGDIKAPLSEIVPRTSDVAVDQVVGNIPITEPPGWDDGSDTSLALPASGDEANIESVKAPVPGTSTLSLDAPVADSADSLEGKPELEESGIGEAQFGLANEPEMRDTSQSPLGPGDSTPEKLDVQEAASGLAEPTGEPIVSQMRLLRDTLRQREAQLENAVMQSTSMNAELESLRERLSQYRAEAKAAQRKWSSASDAKLRKTEARLKEAEGRAEALYSEGLDLSKKQGTLEATLKKVRSDLKQATRERDDAAETRTKLETENCGLKRAIKELKEAEKKASKAVSSNSEFQREIESLKRQVEEEKENGKEHASHLQSSLETALAEVSEQKREISSLNQVLGASRADQEKLRHQLEEHLNSSQLRSGRTSMLEKTLNEARQALLQQTQESNAREDSLQRENKRLRKQMKAVENRNEELMANAAKNTAPLLRQIESLESVNRTQRASFEESSSAIMARVVAAEKSEKEAHKMRKSAEAAKDEALLRQQELEAALSREEKEKERLQTQLQHYTEKLKRSEDENRKINGSIDSMREKYDAQVQDARDRELRARKENAALEEKYEREISSLSKRHSQVVEGFETKLRGYASNLERQGPAYAESRQLHMHRTYGSEVSSQAPFQSQGDILEDLHLRGGDKHFAPVLSRPPSQQSEDTHLPKFEEPSKTGVHQLEAELRRRTGQISSLQAQLAAVERTRDALTEELHRVGERCRTFETQVGRIPEMEKTLQETTLRHDLLLELLGEKEEALEELQADMKTMKDSFRRQLDAFTSATETR